MVSDDLFATLSGAKPAAFDPMATQKLAPEGDRTQQIPALDPAWRPEATQKIEPRAGDDAQVTQRLDDSIWKLQEAKRILQGIGKK
jgi:hypothetical protein